MFVNRGTYSPPWHVAQHQGTVRETWFIRDNSVYRFCKIVVTSAVTILTSSAGDVKLGYESCPCQALMCVLEILE